MSAKPISTAKLKPDQIPTADAAVDKLIRFAHTFDGYGHWGSFERCAEIANGRDHGSIDKLRTCLFFDARRLRHSGEEPDDEALRYWRTLVAEIRRRVEWIHSVSPTWLADAIRRLPSDPPVPSRTQGYNKYTTQKDHWLGWLNPQAGTGTYPRRTGPELTARTVYNRIGEPKMLLWLIEAAGVTPDKVAEANASTTGGPSLASKCAEVRRAVPWLVVAEALWSRERSFSP